jgi:hypothetical protein
MIIALVIDTNENETTLMEEVIKKFGVVITK